MEVLSSVTHVEYRIIPAKAHRRLLLVYRDAALVLLAAVGSYRDYRLELKAVYPQEGIRTTQQVGRFIPPACLVVIVVIRLRLIVRVKKPAVALLVHGAQDS